MIRHVAVFTFVAGFTPAQRADWVAMVRALPGHIPEVLSLSIGEDVVHGPASHDLAIVADFATLTDLETYSTHPAHAAVLAVSAGVKASLAVVDFEV
ncbi:Dabb family protein [Conyzicola sp.]|uniref:Dabb family protein n=1 Tax=Conyzicola sp. TaxID=1969404 RepID=UPI00398A0BAC